MPNGAQGIQGIQGIRGPKGARGESEAAWKMWLIGVLVTLTLGLSAYAWNTTIQRIDEVAVETRENSQFANEQRAVLWQQSVFQCLKIEKIKSVLWADYDRRLEQARNFKPTKDLPRPLIQQSIRNLERVKRELHPDSCEIPFPTEESR